MGFTESYYFFSQVLLTRLRFFRDLGYPYEAALGSSSNRTDLLMCSYVSGPGFNKTDGKIISFLETFWKIFLGT